ncbi:MAG: hypothetical protein P1U85_23315 [Verrucomicrobiales bacterium]|nr:hypothetical protein [Verrucomicrobiales bacterium]
MDLREHLCLQLGQQQLALIELQFELAKQKELIEALQKNPTEDRKDTEENG